VNFEISIKEIRVSDVPFMSFENDEAWSWENSPE
jgi:hypothetical protein